MKTQADGLTLYHEHVLDCLRRFDAEERDNVDRAARAIIRQFKQGKVVHAFGPGVHSYIGVEEMFYRKGGLIPVRPYLAASLSANAGARLATLNEGQPAHADAILEYYSLARGDLLVIFNAYGFNACAVQAALRAHELDAATIALTAPTYSRQVPVDQKHRHPSKKLLCDVADIVVDIKMRAGETVVPIEGVPGRAGGTATLLHAYAWNCIVVRVAEIMTDEGFVPPIWCVEDWSFNNRFLDQFGSQMMHY